MKANNIYTSKHLMGNFLAVLWFEFNGDKHIHIRNVGHLSSPTLAYSSPVDQGHKANLNLGVLIAG